MYLREETREAAKQLLSLHESGKLPLKFRLVRTGWNNEEIPYQVETKVRLSMDSAKLEIPIAIFEELANYKLIQLNETIKEEQKPKGRSGFSIRRVSTGWDILLLPYEMERAINAVKKLKYRHLSQEAKSLAFDLIQYRKENKLDRVFKLALFWGSSGISGLVVWNKNGHSSVQLKPEHVHYMQELASENLLRIEENAEKDWNIELTKKLFDAVDNNFSEIEDNVDSIPPIHFDFRGSNISGQVAVNTGSGNLHQTQNIVTSIAELKELMQRLNGIDEKLESLFTRAEKEPTEENIKLLSGQVAYKAAEILANTGGAVTALATVYKFVEAIIKLL